MTTMRSAKLAIQIVRRSTVIAMIGARNGRVIVVNRCQGVGAVDRRRLVQLAGIAWSAASSVIAKNGMPHQTLAMIGPHSARLGVAQDVVGLGEHAERESQCGSGPITGLNSQAQLRPERKLGTAQGRKTRAWTSLRPRKGSSSSSASRARARTG